MVHVSINFVIVVMMKQLCHLCNNMNLSLRLKGFSILNIITCHLFVKIYQNKNTICTNMNHIFHKDWKDVHLFPLKGTQLIREIRLWKYYNVKIKKAMPWKRTSPLCLSVCMCRVRAPGKVIKCKSMSLLASLPWGNEKLNGNWRCIVA